MSIDSSKAPKNVAQTSLLIALLCVFGWFYVQSTVLDILPSFHGQPSDFQHYFLAADDVLHGRSPFSDPAMLYPPALAFLVTPLALMSYEAARWTWLAISQACLLASAFLMWRALKRGLTAAFATVIVWALGGAASESLALGQLAPVVVLLLTLAYTGSSNWQGIGSGIAAGLKYFPGAPLLAFLLARGRRAVIAFFAATAITLVIPWLVVWIFLAGPKTPPRAAYSMGSPTILSWSIPSVILRILDPPSSRQHLPHNWEFGNDTGSLELSRRDRWISASAAVLVFSVGALALLVAARGRLDPEQIPFASAALIALALAAVPVSWTHYQLLQYPGVAMFLAAAAESRRWRLVCAILALAAFLYPLPVAILKNYYSAHGGWTADSPATLYFWTSVTPIASLALFALFLKEIHAKARLRQPNPPVLVQ